MRTSKFASSIACLALLASCGGGGSNNSSPPVANPGPTPTGGTSGCSLSARQQFAFDVLNQAYLFPELLDTSVNRSNFNDVQSYIDALVAPARAQNRDRFFSYITSIQEETAFQNSGATAGFGVRLGYDTPNRRVFVIETFEGTAALGANIDRGTELLAIGTTSADLVTVNSLMANGGAQAVVNALGPNTPGTTRVLRIRDQSGVEREVTLSKTNYALDPVSDRYGAKIINDGGRQVGYINLRTFSIVSAEQDLSSAFSSFRAAGVSELIIDLRYNGGGLIRVAEHLGDLMGRNFVGNVFSQTLHRPSRSSQDTTYRFQTETGAIAPTRIAFITTGSSASASELIINGMRPYVNNIALVGSNTFGKPVGQEAFDNAACDDRMRPVTIRTVNATGFGDYYTGLAPHMANTCRANDDISRQLGDPSEGMISVALDYLAGRSCTAISGGPATTAGFRDEGVLAPELGDRTAAQHEVPGLF